MGIPDKITNIFGRIIPSISSITNKDIGLIIVIIIFIICLFTAINIIMSSKE